MEGYRVLHIGDEKGALCSKILADFGADVIVIEPPSGHPTRAYAPFYHDQVETEKSLFFWYFHTNMRSVTLQLEAPEGRDLFRTLVRTADVVVETFTPGYLAVRELDYLHLQALHPGLVMTSITGFGQSGPYSQYKAPDIVGLAMGGLAYLCGEPDGPPVPPGGWQGVHLAGLNGATATLIALWHRDMTGEGQHIDVSMQAAVANTLETTHQTYDFNREVRRRFGHKREAAAYILPCQDGYVALLCTGGIGWPRLVTWVREAGGSAFLTDPQLADDGYRLEHEDEVHQALQAFFAPLTKEAIYAEAQRRRLPLAPVNTARDLVESPQLQARGFFVDVEHEDLATMVRYPGAPYALSVTPWQLRCRPPRLGEHNAAVWGQELGLSHEQLMALQQHGIL